ncbi:MAG TPA: hypothetical protein VHO69_07030, partial [Phototrophicaceae bacterium]|nr:hypothetical protein [Phototrophicaceae bacterium]
MRLQYIQQGRILIAQYNSTITLIDPIQGKVRAVLSGEISGLSLDETLAIVQVQSRPVSFVHLADGVFIAPPDSEQFPAHERLIPVTNPQLGCIDAFDSARFYPPPPLKLNRDETGSWLRQVQRLPGSPLVLFIASWDNPMIYGWDVYVYDVLQSRIRLKTATKDRLPTAVYTPSLHLLALAASYDYHFYDLASGHGRGGLSLSEIDRRGYLTPEEVAVNPRKPSVLRYLRAVATNPAAPEMTAAGLDDALHVIHFP